MIADTEWTQVDSCIVSWLYTAWTTIGSQFLDNIVQRTV